MKDFHCRLLIRYIVGKNCVANVNQMTVKQSFTGVHGIPQDRNNPRNSQVDFCMSVNNVVHVTDGFHAYLLGTVIMLNSYTFFFSHNLEKK